MRGFGWLKWLFTEMMDLVEEPEEQLLFCTNKYVPKEGETCQDYYKAHVITRVVEDMPGHYQAYGHRIGPSKGPGTAAAEPAGKLGGEFE